MKMALPPSAKLAASAKLGAVSVATWRSFDMAAAEALNLRCDLQLLHDGFVGDPI
jgi:hypothetical protein